MTETEVILRPGAAGRVAVLLGDEVLIASTSIPEIAGARMLHARGVTGIMWTRWEGSPHRAMKVDIARAAAQGGDDAGEGTGQEVQGEDRPGRQDDRAERKAAPDSGARHDRPREQGQAASRPVGPVGTGPGDGQEARKNVRGIARLLKYVGGG